MEKNTDEKIVQMDQHMFQLMLRLACVGASEISMGKELLEISRHVSKFNPHIPSMAKSEADHRVRNQSRRRVVLRKLRRIMSARHYVRLRCSHTNKPLETRSTVFWYLDRDGKIAHPISVSNANEKNLTVSISFLCNESYGVSTISSYVRRTQTIPVIDVLENTDHVPVGYKILGHWRSTIVLSNHTEN